MPTLKNLLRSLPLPLVYTTISGLLVFISKLAVSDPLYAFLISLVVFILTYVEKYVSTLEGQATVVVTTTPVQAASQQTASQTKPVTIGAVASGTVDVGLKLSASETTVNVGDTITFKWSGASQGGAKSIALCYGAYDNPVQITSQGYVTGATFTYAVTSASPLYYALKDYGSEGVPVFIQDTPENVEGNQSNQVTLTLA
jgi:plastocyanin